MSTAIAASAVQPIVSAKVGTIALLFTTALLAALAYYFIGIDEGGVSVFGKTMVLHEFMHDGRHLLGFPCH